MTNKQSKCFDQLAITRFLDQQSTAEEESLITDHLGSCEVCRDKMEQLSGQSTFYNDLEEHLDFELADDSETHFMSDQQPRDLNTVKSLIGPTENPEMIGRLGHYEVCGIVGRGSAGIVVKALDVRLNRFVAIKLLVPAYSNNGCSRRRFERECKAIASVKNQHVVEIHTVEEFNGTPYIVMPYIPNGSLQHRINRSGPLSPREVVCIGMQVASGLAAAHHRGIVHRDVKPANVLLASGIEGAKVSDFGLARVVDEATLTHSGTISGTPQYMSPEQAQGNRVDQRSDLFSLGSTMYAAATGHPPFKSESVFGIIKKVCDSEPRSILEYNPEMPIWLVALIEKLHRKDPADRFDSADQVAQLLTDELAFMESPTLVSEPTRSWWIQPKVPSKPIVQKFRFQYLAIAAGFVLALFAGIALSSMFGSGENGNSPSESFAASTSREGSPIAWMPVTTEMLTKIQQEHEELPRFAREIVKRIDVQSGGTLFFDSNAGAINVQTHKRPTVEMKWTQVVTASNEGLANRYIELLKKDFSPTKENESDIKYKEGRDAFVKVRYPNNSKMTEEEIEKFDDLESLKEQLLLRNHNAFRKIRFELRIPEEFNLDLKTQGADITLANVDGTVLAETHGGNIGAKTIMSRATLKTSGGFIEIEDAGADATLITSGGHIDAGHIKGKLVARTSGGQIRVASMDGQGEMETSGGQILVLKARDGIDASSQGGAIAVNFVEQPKTPSDLSTSAGSIDIGYVDGVAFDINARSNMGGVSAPFLNKRHSKINTNLNDGEVALVALTNVGSVNFKLVKEGEIDKDIKQHAKKKQARDAFRFAYDLHMAGRIEEAIEAHKKAAKFEQFRSVATYNLGCAYALQGESEKAIKTLLKAVDFGYVDRGLLKEDSDLASLREKPEFQQILDAIDQAMKKASEIEVETENELADAFEDTNEWSRGDQAFQKAYDLHMGGQIDKAIEAHKKAAEFEQYRGIATYNLGCAYALKGEGAKALEALADAVDFGFTNLKQFEEDSDLDSLRKEPEFIEIMKSIRDQDEDEDEDDDETCEDDCNSTDKKDYA